MIAIALVGLALVGAVVTWEKQLPSVSQRVSDLPRRQRIWTLLLFPVTVVVGVGSGALAVAGVRSAPDSAYEAFGVLALAATCIASVVLLALGLWRVLARRSR